jgi:hypothetical protein
MTSEYKNLKPIMRDMKDTRTFSREERRAFAKRAIAAEYKEIVLAATLDLCAGLCLAYIYKNNLEGNNSAWAGELALISSAGIVTAKGTYNLIKRISYLQAIKKTAEAERQRRANNGRVIDSELEQFTQDNLIGGYPFA